MDNLFGWAAIIVAAGGFLKIWFDVRAVHTIVNSQKTAMQCEIDDLRDLIHKLIADNEALRKTKIVDNK